MAYDGTLKFDTAIDKSGFQTGLNGLSSAAKLGMKAITGAVGAASAAISSLGGYAVKVGEAFESSMAQVAATMGVTKDTILEDGVMPYDLLKEAAEAAGESTTFSASEAADALNYLALAGYDAVQAADALPAVLDLAAAGGLDLAYASDLATDAMSALGIEASGENLTRFGDEMAKTASKASTSVAQLGEAILTVGGTAKSLAGGTTELNAALGVLANRGIKGSEGGTALRNIILSLTAPTNQAAEAMENLGLSVLDAEGNMRPINDIFKDMDAALSGLSEGQKTAVLNEIFNKTDLSAVQGMLSGCGDEFDNLTLALSGCDGAMSQMADTMNDTLEGDWKSLKSKAEAFGKAIYDSISDPLRELVQLGGSYISQLTEAFKTGSWDGIAETLGDVLSDAVTVIVGYIPKLVETGVSLISALVKGLQKNAPAIAEAAMSAIGTLMEGILSISADLFALGASLLVTIAKGITEHLPDIIQTAQELITTITDTVTENLPSILKAGIAIISAIAQVLLDNLDLLISSAIQIIKTVCDTLLTADNLQKLLTAGYTLLTTVAQAITDNLGDLIEVALQLVLFLCESLLTSDNLTSLIETAIELLITIVNAIVDNIDEILLAVETIIRHLCDELTKPERLEKLMEMGVKLLTELIVGLCKIAGKLTGFFVMLNSELWEEFGKIDWSAIGTAIVEGICSGLLDCDFILDDYLDNFGDYWVSGIKDVFGIHSPSRVMRDAVGKNLALGIGEGFTEEFPDEALKMAEMLPDEMETSAQQHISIIPDYSIAQVGMDALISKMPEIEIEIPDLDNPDPEKPKPTPPRITDEAAAVFASQSAEMPYVPMQPSATSGVVNNYSYSTVNNHAAPAQESRETAPMTFQLVIDGETVADAVVDKIDEKQGNTIILKKRGLTK